MEYEKALEVIDGQFDFEEDDTSGQKEALINLLCEYGVDEEEIKNARIDGIKFALEVASKYGTAKTFKERMNKEINKNGRFEHLVR